MNKGGEFYDKLGTDVGIRNPTQSALATFIDIFGWFVVWRLIFTKTKFAITVFCPPRLPSPSI